MTTSKEKVRSVFLTTIMVLSLLAIGSAGFAGTAAANDAGSISGDITQGDVEASDAPDGVTVTAVNEEGGEFTTETDDGDGSYTISDLPDGEYTLVANISEYESDTATASVSDGEEVGDVNLENLGPDVEVSPDELIEGAEETLSGSSQIADGDRISFELQDSDGEGVGDTDGSTLSGDFSISNEFDSTGIYNVEVKSDEHDVANVHEVQVGYDVADVEFDPAEPQFGDDVTASGSVFNDDGDAVDAEVSIEDENGETVGDAVSTDSNGDFIISETYNDAGQFNLTVDDETDIVYDSVTTSAEELNLTIDSEGDNVRSFSEEYTVTLEDLDGEPVETDGDIDGYINVTGPFAEDSVSDVEDDATAEDDEIEWVQVSTDDSGEASFTATPVGDNITSMLEVEHDDNTYEGLEVTTDIETYETPDYVADRSMLDVVDGEPLNVEP